jgi:hypothetical protein
MFTPHRRRILLPERVVKAKESVKDGRMRRRREAGRIAWGSERGHVQGVPGREDPDDDPGDEFKVQA